MLDRPLFDRPFDETHESFREMVREFAAREVAPHIRRWEEDHDTPRDVWLAAGAQGLLGLAIPEEFSGLGMADYRYRIILDQELAAVGALATALGFHLHDDLVLPFLLDLGTEEQKRRWLPGMATGEVVGSHAFTEPGAGSDLRSIRTKAARDGDEWVINGQKVFIGNGRNSDITLVLAATEAGPSLFVVPRSAEGFTSGKPLEKLGLMASDTTEQFFRNARVPADHLLGEEGKGLEYARRHYIQARLAIAAASATVSRQALAWTTRYVGEREAFGHRILDFQNTRFVLADLQARTAAAEALLDRAVDAFNTEDTGPGSLGQAQAAAVKLFCSETNLAVADACLQLHGGYGYMREYPIAQAFLASRLLTIFGGTSEIMKETIMKETSA